MRGGYFVVALVGLVGVAAWSARDADAALRLRAQLGDERGLMRLAARYEGREGRQPDYAAAAGLYMHGARRGDPVAQRRLGTLYQQGQGVPKDVARARGLYARAAAAGDMDAQVLAATCCHLGLGGPRDLPAALRWYEAAARQGDTSAMFALAFLYEGGDGVTPDPAKVRHWYTVAAERNVAAAQFHLGLLCEERHALDEAVQWYSLAAAQRHGLARQALSDLERTWPAARLAVGRARAAAWRGQHAPRRHGSGGGAVQGIRAET